MRNPLEIKHILGNPPVCRRWKWFPVPSGLSEAHFRTVRCLVPANGAPRQIRPVLGTPICYMEFYDPEERAREKQISRDEDVRALNAGEITVDELRRKNAAVPLGLVRLKPGQPPARLR